LAVGEHYGNVSAADVDVLHPDFALVITPDVEGLSKEQASPIRGKDSQPGRRKAF
jgi:hypothetical protein